MRRSPLTFALAATIGATLVGCSSTDDTGGGCTPGSTVKVGATNELKFDAERYTAKGGCIEFDYTNKGSTAHTLLIKNVKDFKLSIGNEDTGTTDLTPGTYTLFCDIAGHESAGMVAELTVS